MRQREDQRTVDLPGLPPGGGYLVGYARVSTIEQDTRLQLDALSRAGVSKVYSEKRSGADRARPELGRMLEQLRPGDVVAVYKLDRLARSLADLLHILARIEAAGARFRSLTETIDTTTPAGRMLMQLLGAFAEFERGMIRERSLAGLRAAQARGVRCGRRPSLSESEGRKAAEQYHDRKATLAALARLYGCHVSSIKRAIRRASGLDVQKEEGPPKRAQVAKRPREVNDDAG